MEKIICINPDCLRAFDEAIVGLSGEDNCPHCHTNQSKESTSIPPNVGGINKI